MTRFASSLLALTASLSLVACAAQDVDLTTEEVLAEVDGALEVAEDAEGTVGLCIEDLAGCIADGAEGCRAAFKECMPKLGKHAKGGKGKHPRARKFGDEVDGAADAVDGEKPKGPRKGPRGQLRMCIHEMVGCILDDGGDVAECADTAKACVKAAAQAHKAHMCEKGLAHCAAGDAPAELCAKIDEKCAQE